MDAASDRIAITPAERRAAVIDVIGAARSRLLLSLFRCDDFEVLDALADALRRGVRVEVLMTDRAKGGRKGRDQLETVLGDAGATLHRYGDPVVKYHAKYIIADTCALVASANWTHKCMERTCDFALVTTDLGVVRALTAVCAADCAREALASDLLHERVITGPENARERLTALLGGARRSIEIVDPKLTDPAMRQLLAERRRAGVRVVCHEGDRVGSLTAHGKLIVVDDRVAVIGSLSLSAIHLAFRRELALTTTDCGVIESLIDFLATLPGSGRQHRDGGRNRAPAGRGVRPASEPYRAR
jgi:phosphatidylserine/phosphatidylglycerophosphate/cardiolipin synthase-like enzyme